MESVLSKMDSDNPDVVLLAIKEARALNQEEKEIVLHELKKNLENSRKFLAISKAIIMDYFMTHT